jgi:MoaA/NifB/PqqE/SkfB family radical SAM enzyme
MQAILMVNSKQECNLRCLHCYLPYGGMRTPEDALETTKQLQDHGHQVIIAGSETLVDPSYLKAYQQAGQKYLLTNGILLHRDNYLYDALQEHGIKAIRSSIHFGLEDELRSASPYTVAEVLGKAQQRGIRTEVSTTITPNNYLDVQGMCKIAKGYGVSSIQFLKMIKSGRGIDRETLNPEQILEFFDLVQEARTRYSKDDLDIRVHGNFSARPGSKGEKSASRNCYCNGGKSIVAIDPDDKVYSCPFTMGPDAVIGHLNKGEIVIERELFSNKRDRCIADLVSEM